MNERQRLVYLEVMGVASYAPRFVLPGAKASPLCAIPALDTEPVTPAVAVSTELAQLSSRTLPSPQLAPLSTPVPERMALAVEDLPGSKTAAKTELDAPKKPERNDRVQHEKVPRFSLSMSRFSDGLMFVDDTGDGRREQDHRRLLQGIALALGGGAELSESALFQWPMVESRQLDQGPAAAAETFAAYIDAQIERHGVQRLILMSPAALALFEGAADDQAGSSMPEKVDGVAATVEIPGVGVMAVACISAWRLLDEPGLKAQAWRMLQGMSPAGQ